jgi:hypothetical protein
MSLTTADANLSTPAFLAPYSQTRLEVRR